MTPERWRQVESLFHSVCELPSSDREQFLNEACAADTNLKRDVESLLAERDGTLLSGGLAGAAARVMSPPGSWENRQLGVYQLGPMIGAGGMGEVYRARDTRLGRDVAVKILPEALSGSSERLARFEREARILATLNHPNIAAIYGVEEGAGDRALVLELVEGMTLAEMLLTETGVARALSVEYSLLVARQIARACEAAHQKGIVHRDLKPANIKIAPDGTVKVLDFGVAKFDAPREPGPSGQGVLTTSEGAVLGTVAYMSPEQARGLSVDRRTDIWAFGCILYEMLTGCRSFPGDSSADVLGAIISRDPDWTLLPADTPVRVRDVLRRCLAKDAERRYHDIADVRVDLDEAMDAAAPASASASPSTARQAWRMRLPWIVAGAMAAVAIAVWVLLPQTTERLGPARVSIELPPAVAVYEIGRGSSVAISPDGQRIVYVAVDGSSTRLMTRMLAGSENTPLPGSEGATNPFFSPDGRWIGFSADRWLKKISASGGVATTVADTRNQPGVGALGAAWGDDDTIVHWTAPAGELWRVSPSGATPQRVTGAAGSWPHILPGARSIVYSKGGGVVMQPLAGGSPTLLVERGSYGRVIARGGIAFLVYARPEGLMAARFDLEGGRVTGTPELVQPGVQVNLSGGAHFDVAANGVLAYVPGGLTEGDKTHFWVDTSGKTTELPPMPGVGFQYRLSPDGKKLARSNAAGAGDGNRDVWIDNLTDRSKSIRLTFDQVTNLPIWTLDSSRVIYSKRGQRDQLDNLYWRAADDPSGEEQRLTTSKNQQTAGSVTPDGTLLYQEHDPKSGFDIWMLPLDASGPPRRLISTPRNEAIPKISPNGRWVAYQSNISGTVEVHVAPFPSASNPRQISQGGGQSPMWSPDGHELYYRTEISRDAHKMMAVSIDTTGSEPRIGTPRVVFPGPFQGFPDIAPDGRFLLVKQTTRESATRVIQLVFDWFDELQTKLPPPR